MFMPHLVTGLGDVIVHAGHVANGNTPLRKANYFFFVVVNFNSEVVQLQLKSPSFPSIQSRHCSDGQHLIITFTISVSSTILSR